MAGRPSLKDPHAHLTGEMGKIVNLPQRRMQTLRDGQHFPYSNDDAARLAREGLHDENTLAQLSIIAALETSGVALRTATEIVGGFVEGSGDLRTARYSNLDAFAPVRPHDGEWFANFCVLSQSTDDTQRLAAPLPNDTILHIADGMWVLTDYYQPRLKCLPEPAGNMLDMRNPAFAYVPIWTLVDWDDEVAVEKCRREYRTGLENAYTKLTVNLSLSIRRAFMLAHGNRIDTGRALPTVTS